MLLTNSATTKPPFQNSGSTGSLTIKQDNTTNNNPPQAVNINPLFQNKSLSLPDISMNQPNNNQTSSLSGASLLFDNIHVNDLVSSTPMLQQNNTNKQQPNSATNTPVNGSSINSISSPPSVITTNNGPKLPSTPTPVTASINTNNIQTSTNSSSTQQEKPPLSREL